MKTGSVLNSRFFLLLAVVIINVVLRFSRDQLPESDKEDANASSLNLTQLLDEMGKMDSQNDSQLEGQNTIEENPTTMESSPILEQSATVVSSFPTTVIAAEWPGEFIADDYLICSQDNKKFEAMEEWHTDYVPPNSESQSDVNSGLSDKGLTTLLPQEPTRHRPVLRADKQRLGGDGGTISKDIPHSTTAPHSPGKQPKTKMPPTVNNAATHKMPPTVNNAATHKMPPTVNNAATHKMPPTVNNAATHKMPPTVNNAATHKMQPTVNNAATQVTQSLYQDKMREAGVQAHLSQDEQCAADSESTQGMLTRSFFDGSGESIHFSCSERTQSEQEDASCVHTVSPRKRSSGSTFLNCFMDFCNSRLSQSKANVHNKGKAPPLRDSASRTPSADKHASRLLSADKHASIPQSVDNHASRPLSADTHTGILDASQHILHSTQVTPSKAQSVNPGFPISPLLVTAGTSSCKQKLFNAKNLDLDSPENARLRNLATPTIKLSSAAASLGDGNLRYVVLPGLKNSTMASKRTSSSRIHISPTHLHKRKRLNKNVTNNTMDNESSAIIIEDSMVDVANDEENRLGAMANYQLANNTQSTQKANENRIASAIVTPSRDNVLPHTLTVDTLNKTMKGKMKDSSHRLTLISDVPMKAALTPKGILVSPTSDNLFTEGLSMRNLNFVDNENEQVVSNNVSTTSVQVQNIVQKLFIVTSPQTTGDDDMRVDRQQPDDESSQLSDVNRIQHSDVNQSQLTDVNHSSDRSNSQKRLFSTDVSPISRDNNDCMLQTSAQTPCNSLPSHQPRRPQMGTTGRERVEETCSRLDLPESEPLEESVVSSSQQFLGLFDTSPISDIGKQLLDLKFSDHLMMSVDSYFHK